MKDRSPLEQRTLALAGVAQAARIVDLAAKTGSWPTPFVEASIHSLFCFDPEEVDSVFGTPQGIRLGLEQLSACLRLSQDPAAADTLRYTMAILQLEKQFATRDDLQAIVHSRLKHTAYKAENFSSDIRGLSSNISAIYQDTLSTLSYRIKVTGSAQHLNNPQVADLVRAVLMCGIRAAFLWRQLGGSRLKLMWQRGAIRDTAAGMARELGVTH
ncbi:MAG: high frequency lysogenization protein HflD [Luminiphilus sp.]|jgi:high frequency lysogenization protein